MQYLYASKIPSFFLVLHTKVLLSISPSLLGVADCFMEMERVIVVDIYFSGGRRELVLGEGGTNRNGQVVITVVNFSFTLIQSYLCFPPFHCANVNVISCLFHVLDHLNLNQV